ncbi:hypothetical protein PGB90_007393 [Kerria lacca]
MNLNNVALHSKLWDSAYEMNKDKNKKKNVWVEVTLIIYADICQRKVSYMLKSLKALSPPYTYIIDNDEPMNPGNGYALSNMGNVCVFFLNPSVISSHSSTNCGIDVYLL